VIFMFNSAQGPCSDPRVRRALSQATDAGAIIRDVMHGAAEPLSGPLTPLHFGYDPESKPYGLDLEKARKLLREAGHGDDLALTVDIPSVMPDESPGLAKALTEQWARVGVTLRTRVHTDRTAYSHMVRDKRIGDACCFDSSPMSAFRVLREKIHSGLRGPWWEGYSNPRVDELIDKAQRTIGDTERAAFYREAYRLIRGDAPWLFLYRPINYWALGSGVEWAPSWDGVIRV
jgi:peptide/nickel transport system substrate-binding protein